VVAGNAGYGRGTSGAGLTGERMASRQDGRQSEECTRQWSTARRLVSIVVNTGRE